MIARKYDLYFGIFYEKLDDNKKYLSNHDIKTQEQPVDDDDFFCKKAL